MKNYGRASFGISIFVHALFIAGMPSFVKANIFVHQTKKEQAFKDISEIKIIPHKEEARKAEQDKRFSLTDDIPPPYINNLSEKFLINNEKKISLDKPPIAQERISEVAIADISSKDLEKIPEYMPYYNSVREKINKTAYRLYDGQDKGIVFLSFVVLPDGRLQGVYLEEQSENNPVLREIAIKSIYEAAPFAPFPKELANRSNLPFRVPINFKNN
ncbi:MAG: energy transducer TonB [Candidatus Omnitrophica bacterium]|nr:energy transducer TonB [Candidatus Omnitrophota bacterium]